HIWGNQVFDPYTDIISTEKVLKNIKESGNPFDQTYQKYVKDRLFALQGELNITVDESRRNEISFWLPYYQGLVESLPMFRLRLPNITFSERMVIQGSKRHVEILTFGEGHSKGDAVLYLPQEKIMFMGDLLFIEGHPYMGDGDPDGWMRVLDKLKEFELDYIVPGHGPVGTNDDIQRLQEYFIYVKEEVQSAIDSGSGEKGLADISIPDEYNLWGMSSFFDSNLAFLYKMLSEQ
ncbi:MAG: MBL fold metallo-hydrolase, partial [Anaerolineaceae bacterium]|nr:MBL fold metallo-hydrolase [Anaerolineaceae bacterium]